ncbi:DUF3667 domain-containing protein [Gloeobacter violaceus]|nr:DUF3667 domain-containing protein [Gloeobacter violaceus]
MEGEQVQSEGKDSLLAYAVNRMFSFFNHQTVRTMAEADARVPQPLPVDSPVPAKLTRAQKREQVRAARRSPVCLNCGELTPGNYCINCGQLNETYRVSTRKLVADFINDYFTVDLKFPKSVLPLLFKPGFLTNEYIAGRRARYIAPLRMYLFVSVLYFVILGFFSNTLFDNSNDFTVQTDAGADAPAKVLDNSKATRKIDNALKPPNPKLDPPGADQKGVSVRIGDDGSLPLDIKPEDIEVDTGNPDLDRFLDRQIRAKVDDYTAPGGQERLIRDIEDNLPIAVFTLLPVFAFLLKVFYWRSGRYYAEHLIFSLHFHAFIFLTLGLATLVNSNLLLPWTPVVHLLYLFVAMMMVYQQGWLKTLIKYSLLIIGYSIAIIFSIVLVALLTFVF